MSHRALGPDPSHPILWPPARTGPRTIPVDSRYLLVPQCLEMITDVWHFALTVRGQTVRG